MAANAFPVRNQVPPRPRSNDGDWLAVLFLIVLAGLVLGAYALDHYDQRYWSLLPARSSGKLLFLSLTLAGLLLVARWYKRLGSNSDIEELRKAAFSYRLGGTSALRPFLREGGETLEAGSPLAEYRASIDEPGFLQLATNPPFLLALALVLSLGLLAFYAEDLGIVTKPSLILAGPILAQKAWLMPSEPGTALAFPPELQKEIVIYQSGAIACIIYALMGALVWSIVYLARRMALRDVTPHAYQAITVRIATSAVVALFLYHLFATTNPDAPIGGFFGAVTSTIGLTRADVFIVVSFAAGLTPEVALRWLAGKVRWLFGQKNPSDELNLEVIEGVDSETRVRLAEVGIYDAQGLATTNPLHLTLRTPFSLPQILDWIGQCFLFMQLGRDGFEKARASGLRTAWQLGPPPPAAPAAVAPVPPAPLPGAPAAVDEGRLLGILARDPCYGRASEIVERMRLRG